MWLISNVRWDQMVANSNITCIGSFIMHIIRITIEFSETHSSNYQTLFSPLDVFNNNVHLYFKLFLFLHCIRFLRSDRAIHTIFFIINMHLLLHGIYSIMIRIFIIVIISVSFYIFFFFIEYVIRTWSSSCYLYEIRPHINVHR